MIFLEGKGSLLSFLKGKGWATSLSAGVGDDGINRSSLAYVFGMSIHLTDSGLEKITNIFELSLTELLINRYQHNIDLYTVVLLLFFIFVTLLILIGSCDNFY